ncbi:scaffolding protein [Cronobacter phage vB_CsaP_GAP52]|uniref:Scaffolding protein n=1 Tax=Cronobacter phage vB_CsaP_GAP52 TaxID=1141137 RepID=K4F6T6_9CAUD|nr:head scaffolding protein [Cronobacter phage vB_CsaP_GAP52]AFC22001.1 scaffolding protein [Cronobacter phage vB_CsaP_GAP52]
MAEITNENSMIIDDMDNFDFLSLEDDNAIVPDNLNGYETEQTGKDLMTKEELEEAGEEVEEDELPEEDDESEENEEAEEAEESEEESEESDEEEVDFESYEVTLPSGETVVLSEAIKGYKDAQALEAERAEFETVREKFAAQSQGVTKYLELAKLEADRVIEDYEDFDWAAYKKDDPVGYVENREFLDRYKQRRDEITAAMDEVAAERERKEQEEFQEKAREAGVVLARDIPGWNNDLYQQLMMFAVENGADANEIAQTVDPTIFKVLYKAMQYEKGKQVVKAKVKKVGSPKKVAKSGSKPTQTVDAKGATKKALIKKIESGTITDSELSNSFAFLED